MDNLPGMALCVSHKKYFSTLYGYEHLCAICGAVLTIDYLSGAISGALAADWRLTPEQLSFFEYREGCACRQCGATVRGRHLGKVLAEIVNLKYGHKFQFVKDISVTGGFAGAKVAEINNCGVMHRYLAQFNNLSYSEYGSLDPAIPSEDLLQLSYPDDCFDIVLTSDVLEHVPRYPSALVEVKRVLKKDGVFIFTVPFLLDRKTLRRAELNEEGGIIHRHSPSYHGDYASSRTDYLVFYEFGYDFLQELKEIFEMGLYCHEGYGGFISSVFVCWPRK